MRKRKAHTFVLSAAPSVSLFDFIMPQIKSGARFKKIKAFPAEWDRFRCFLCVSDAGQIYLVLIFLILISQTFIFKFLLSVNNLCSEVVSQEAFNMFPVLVS